MRIVVRGRLPKAFAIPRKAVAEAARMFAEASARRVGAFWHEVTVHLVDDCESAAVHMQAMGIAGATDAITLAYDAFPPVSPGLFGELFINTEQAMREAQRINRRNWTPANELLLYIAHGMDHLSGADDAGEKDYRAMRRRELAWLRSVKYLMA
ncbi:MAG: rRNA maturation RNase YbeY [Kiritimatiellae bacterium]|nr:rRNA maturation RNase YbeY [Kiritimatiellia bacterium]